MYAKHFLPWLNSLTDVEAYQGLFSLRPSSFDEFECHGTEESLLECNYSQNNCTVGQQAGLFCDGGLTIHIYLAYLAGPLEAF